MGPANKRAGNALELHSPSLPSLAEMKLHERAGMLAGCGVRGAALVTAECDRGQRFYWGEARGGVLDAGASAAAEGHAEVSKTSDDAVGVHADVVDADGGLARQPGAQEQGDGLTGPDLSVDGKRDVAEVAADEGLEIGHFDNVRFFGF